METVVIVGASLSGIRAASTLRDEKFEGRIVLVGAENHAPYDRPPLSKQFLAGKWDRDRIALMAPQKLEALGLDLRLGHRVTAIDPEGHTVELDDGGRVTFDKAVIATGSHPKQLRGVLESRAVMTLRTIDDSRRLSAALGDGDSVTHLVVVGGGFIGAEVAATAKARGAEVTVLEALDVPLQRVLGDRIGGACKALHESHGVEVRTGTGVTGISTAGSGAVVNLDDGTELGADVVVVGIGIAPTTEWLEGSGVEVSDGVLVDSTLHATDDVLAAGDVARWVDDESGSTTRAEHWTNAAEQGAAVARSLLAGRRSAEHYLPLPYIWSDQYDIKIQVLGNPRPDDVVEVVDGSEEDGRFVAIFGRGGNLTAAVGFGRPRQLMRFRSLLLDHKSFEEARSFLSA